jgi:hypothetical protein
MIDHDVGVSDRETYSGIDSDYLGGRLFVGRSASTTLSGGAANS